MYSRRCPFCSSLRRADDKRRLPVFTTSCKIALADGTVLIGTHGVNENVYKSARNIEGVKVLPAAEFNCYTLLKMKRLLLTRAALEALIHPVKAEPVSATEAKRIPRRGRAGRIQRQKAAAK